MKQLLVSGGKVVCKEVPSPQPGPHEILVQTWYSAVSPGTEKSQLRQSGLKVFKTLAGDRNRRSQGLAYVNRKGIAAAWRRLNEAAFTERALGYSLSGVIIDLGQDVTDLRIGDRVACAGAGKACHAEQVVVPEKLAVVIPQGVTMREAATVGLGAVALQGIRQAQPSLGETVAVIGLGVLGQLTVRLLQASGCCVAGFDIDSRRVAEIAESGLEYSTCVTEKALDSILADIAHITNGHGVDACIVTAGASDNSPLDLACDIVKQKGRIVIVGDIPVVADRGVLYKKELEMKLSCSYGPGRYDPSYEEFSMDYPYAYVRWTENRNMACYLDLIRKKSIDVATVFDRIFPFEEAPGVYKKILKKQLTSAVFRYIITDKQKTVDLRTAAPLKEGNKHSTSLFYQGKAGDDSTGKDKSESLQASVTSAAPDSVGSALVDVCRSASPDSLYLTLVDAGRKATSGPVQLALVGAGSYTRSVLIPCLQVLKKLYRVVSVCDIDGLLANRAAAAFDTASPTAEYESVLENDAVDAVIIATRHDLHARMICQALAAGKAVLCEKPAALTREELREVAEAARRSDRPCLVGFNRRYSPLATMARRALSKWDGPVVINYRVAAGALPADHWVRTDQGGGRIIGEMCHMVDLICYLTGSTVESVQAVTASPPGGPNDDNLQVLFKMVDGSTASLTYTAMGAAATAKENIEVLFGASTCSINDFSEYTLLEGRNRKERKRIRQDKGHMDELRMFWLLANGIDPRAAGHSPYGHSPYGASPAYTKIAAFKVPPPEAAPDIEEIIHVTEVTFDIIDSLKGHGAKP